MFRAQPFLGHLGGLLQGGAGRRQISAFPPGFRQAEQCAGIVEGGSFGILGVEIDGLSKELLAFRGIPAVDQARQVPQGGADRKGIGAVDLPFQLERLAVAGLGDGQVA